MISIGVKSMNDLPMQIMLLSEKLMAQAKPLVSFDSGDDLYHILLFDFGDDGGAVGVLREGDDFCVRISLDALATVNSNARLIHVDQAALN